MNHETLEQAIDQWLKENEKGIAYEHESSIAIHAFKAGASWREQQAASGFQEYWQQNYYKITNRVGEDDAKNLWADAQLSSSKLLAEKDKDIVRTNRMFVDSRREIESLKKEIAEKDAEIERLKERIEELDYCQKAFWEATKKVGW